MALVIETRSSHGSVSRTHLRAGTTRVVVRPGDTFRLYDEDTGKAPAKAVVKQLDNSILVDNLADGAQGADQPQAVELLGFYSSCSVSSPCHLELPETTSGTVDITPATGAIGALSDGSFVLVDLAQTSGAAAGGAAAKGLDGAAPAVAEGADHAAESGPLLSESARPVIYGLGGAAVLGLALAGGGGGGGGGEAPVANATATPALPPTPATPATPATPTVSPSVTDPSFTVTHSSVAKGKVPTLTGTGTAGATVKIDVHASGSAAVDASYSVPVGADGKWSANLAMLKPTTGALPAGGLSTTTSLSLAETVNGKTATMPDFKLTADDTPPTAPTISPVGTDGLLGAAAVGKPLAVSGHGEANSLIKLTLGAQNLETVVGADGTWAVTLPANALPATGSATLSVTASDLAGNVSTAATQTLTVDTTPPPAPTIQFTGGADNYVNAAEKAAGVTLAGTAEADSTMKVTVGTVSHDAKAGADGKWSVAFAGAELPADGTHLVTAVATDKAGNASAPSAGTPMVVDTKPPVLTDTHAGGTDRVMSGIPFLITGKTEAGASVQVEFTLADGSKQVQTAVVTDTGPDSANWTLPTPIVALGNPIGAKQTTIHVTATDKAGNVSAVDHTFAIMSQSFPFGTTPAAGSNALSLKALTSGSEGDAIQKAQASGSDALSLPLAQSEPTLTPLLGTASAATSIAPSSAQQLSLLLSQDELQQGLAHL
ncbi:Ig-like domain-containing protein [Lautropia mirabilis]